MILSLTKKPAAEPEILSEIPTAAPECVEAPVQEPVPVAAGVSDEPAPLSVASEAPTGEALTSTASEEESPAEMPDDAPTGDTSVPEEAAAPTGEPIAPVKELPAEPAAASPIETTPEQESAPAFCKECGTQILQPGVQKFCIKCGKKLDS